jgi:hypothetical protein
LTGLRVDTAAMDRNLAPMISDGPLDIGHAGDLVDRYLNGRAT